MNNTVIKKIIFGMFIFALVIGIGITGYANQATAHGDGDNLEWNSQTKEDFMNFHEEMWNLMSKYSMDHGMMGGFGMGSILMGNDSNPMSQENNIGSSYMRNGNMSPGNMNSFQ